MLDDDLAVRDAIRKLIASAGLRVETFGSASEFFSTQRPDVPSCPVIDVRLPDVSGLEFQRALAEASTTKCE